MSCAENAENPRAGAIACARAFPAWAPSTRPRVGRTPHLRSTGARQCRSTVGTHRDRVWRQAPWVRAHHDAKRERRCRPEERATCQGRPRRGGEGGLPRRHRTAGQPNARRAALARRRRKERGRSLRRKSWSDSAQRWRAAANGRHYRIRPGKAPLVRGRGDSRGDREKGTRGPKSAQRTWGCSPQSGLHHGQLNFQLS